MGALKDPDGQQLLLVTKERKLFFKEHKLPFKPLEGVDSWVDNLNFMLKLCCSNPAGTNVNNIGPVVDRKGSMLNPNLAEQIKAGKSLKKAGDRKSSILSIGGHSGDRRSSLQPLKE